MAAKTIELPSGKKVREGWNPKKSEFLSIMEYVKPYKDMPPKERGETLEKDYEFLKKKGRVDKKELGAE